MDRVIKNVNSEKKPINISVPDSSNTAAIGYAHENQKLGFDCKYDIGFIRNHYVGRTFISPGQKSREQKVRTKYNTVKGVLEGRSVIIVDDSIVRGTTSRRSEEHTSQLQSRGSLVCRRLLAQKSTRH